MLSAAGKTLLDLIATSVGSDNWHDGNKNNLQYKRTIEA